METTYRFWRKRHCFLAPLKHMKWLVLILPFRTQAWACWSLRHREPCLDTGDTPWRGVGTNIHEGLTLCWAQSSTFVIHLFFSPIPRNSCHYPHVTDETSSERMSQLLKCTQSVENRAGIESSFFFWLWNARFPLYITTLGPYLTHYTYSSCALERMSQVWTCLYWCRINLS